MIPLWKAGPALACGNAFLLKPSERDPSVPVRLAELFIEAGLPPGVFQVVHGDKEAVDAILNHPDIQAVGFVGSSDIAQYIYAGAAATGKRSQCFGTGNHRLHAARDLLAQRHLAAPVDGPAEHPGAGVAARPRREHPGRRRLASRRSG